MPGFALQQNNPNKQIPNAKAEPRFKHRWTFSVALTGTQYKNIFLYLKSASRPKVNVDSVEMWHNQAPAYFAGRSQWNSISITFYDIQEDPDVSAALWDWHQMVVKHTADDSAEAKKVKDYKKNGTLEQLKADGTCGEKWILHNCWPVSVDFQSLDYSSSEIQTIVAELKYDAATREPC